ncbi:MAG: hypothetical protein GDA36_06285 [Rhodobacteraceae bacterium]|nr:hypothetical protein [Paracoccaceae bacterium]
MLPSPAGRLVLASPNYRAWYRPDVERDENNAQFPTFWPLFSAALPADCALTPAQGFGELRYRRPWHDAPNPLRADDLTAGKTSGKAVLVVRLCDCRCLRVEGRCHAGSA